jgi:hypothetical protein
MKVNTKLELLFQNNGYLGNNNNNNNNFYIALIPLTHELNRSKCGYKVYGTERKINHLLYVDDLKLIGRSEKELRNEIKIVKNLAMT